MKAATAGKVAWRLLLVFLFTSILMQSVFRLSFPRKYAEIVERYAEEYRLPPELLYAVIKTESNFDPEAVSRVGAIGLMQIMPETFIWLTEKTGERLPPEYLTEPEVNIRYGTFFLHFLYEYYGNYETALAAYNAGMGNVAKWLSSDEYAKDGILVKIPFRETERYVRLVTKRAEQYKKLYNGKDKKHGTQRHSLLQEKEFLRGIWRKGTGGGF